MMKSATLKTLIVLGGFGAALTLTACGGDDGGGQSTDGSIDSLDAGGTLTLGGDGDGDGDGDATNSGGDGDGDGDGDGATNSGGDGDGDGDGDGASSGGIKFDVGDGIMGGGGQCEDIELTGEYEPPNVFLVLDVSCSMNGAGWTDLTSTVNWMISNYDASVRFGCRFFPGAMSASACVYTPDVAIGDNQGTAILNVMNGETPNNGTPIYPGIHTGLEELKKEPTGQRVMIALTDGSASSTCSPSTNVDQQCADEILAARQNDNVTTYVIGLGSFVDTAALNSWANAGGTPQNKPGGIDYLEASDQATLQAAFQQIINSVISCVITLDPAPGPEVKKIEVEVDGVVYDTPLPGTTCPATGDGYIFPNAPSRDVLELCNGACDDLKNILSADITYSCGQG